MAALLGPGSSAASRLNRGGNESSYAVEQTRSELQVCLGWSAHKRLATDETSGVGQQREADHGGLVSFLI